ncbi:ankyrin repeat domain-containing protein [bacterium]|nr:ankyrin repeat domain-containing protein [bacterium]
MKKLLIVLMLATLTTCSPATAADKPYWNPLQTAAANGNITTLRRLIQEGGNIEMLDSYDNTLLHLAAAKGHLKAVALLLGQKNILKNLDAVDKGGWTPLHKAVFNGHLEIAQLLVTCGANKTIKTGDGMTLTDLDALGTEMYKCLVLPRARTSDSSSEAYSCLFSGS